MEVLVATATGKVLAVQPSDYPWGVMEDYDLYTASLRDPAAWSGRLCLIRVPDMPYVDGARYRDGTVSRTLIAETAPVGVVASWAFELAATPGDAY